ncbi:hypothetical protein L0337_15025 [candidate division KSB1 bacterium]|nr:hypothetical protein [candidate division KSB1 bacterium]
MEAFSVIGNIASIIGALISVWVLLDVKRLRAHFLFRARIPDLMKLLKKHANTLSESLRNFVESQRDVESVLPVCESTLKNLKTKLYGDVRQTTKNLLGRIRRRTKPTSRDQAWEIYEELQALIEALTHLWKDKKWSE